jgi:hypothetical protein
VTQAAQIQNTVDFSQKMIGWNVFIEPKFIEQPLLQLPLLPHHPLGPPTVDDLLILTDQGGSRVSFSTVSKNSAP